MFCCGLILCTTPACFSTFYQPTIIPTYPSWKFLILLYASLTFLLIIDWLMNPKILHHKVVMVRHTQITFESEVSMTVLCQLYSPHCTAVQINSSLKGTSVIKMAVMKNTDGTLHPSYHLKLNYPWPFSVSYARLVTQQYESRTVW